MIVQVRHMLGGWHYTMRVREAPLVGDVIHVDGALCRVVSREWIPSGFVMDRINTHELRLMVEDNE